MSICKNHLGEELTLLQCSFQKESQLLDTAVAQIVIKRSLEVRKRQNVRCGFVLLMMHKCTFAFLQVTG